MTRHSLRLLLYIDVLRSRLTMERRAWIVRQDLPRKPEMISRHYLAQYWH